MSGFTLLPDYPVESPEWFAARGAGITASDMQLLGRGTPSAFAAVKARKLGQDRFTGNVYTAWGREREPVIASHVEFLHGVAPTDRVAVADADPRWLASPDGLSESLLGEYKTTGTPWPVDVQSIPLPYVDQVLWAQFVTGIHETVFAWEVREGAAPYFTPGAFHHLIIPHDPARVAELVRIAEDFWAYWHSEQVSGEWDSIVAEWALMEARAAEVAAERAELEARIRDRADGRDVSAKTPFGSLSLATPKPRAALDQAAFKQAHPDLYTQFTKITPPSRQTLRVTVGGKK